MNDPFSFISCNIFKQNLFKMRPLKFPTLWVTIVLLQVLCSEVQAQVPIFSIKMEQVSSTRYKFTVSGRVSSGTLQFDELAWSFGYDGTEVSLVGGSAVALQPNSHFTYLGIGGGGGSATFASIPYSHRSDFITGWISNLKVTLGTTEIPLMSCEVDNSIGTSGVGGTITFGLTSEGSIGYIHWTPQAGYGEEPIELANISGPRTFMVEEVTSTYNGSSWDNGTLESLRSFDHALISSGTYNSTGNISIKDLTINSGAQLSIGSGHKLEVNGSMSNNAGTSGLSIEATNGGYGQYLGPATSITAKQYVGNNAGWRYIGWPVNSDFTALSGVQLNYGGGTNGNAYVFDNTTFQWSAVANSSYNPGANGIALFTGGANFPVSGGTLSWTGTSNFSASPFTYAYASSPNADAGWNMISNPYPCNVDWHTVDDQQSGVFSHYYAYNPVDQTYTQYSEAGGRVGNNSIGRYLSPMQAVFVKASMADDGKTITFANSDRTTAGGDTNFVGNYKTSQTKAKGTLDRIYLEVTAQGSGKQDALAVIFPQQSTKGYEPQYDGYKKFNTPPNPNLYSVASSGEKLATNGFGTFDPTNIIPLGFEADSSYGYYELSLYLPHTDPNWGDIYLLDKHTNYLHNLTVAGKYVFNHSQMAPNDRFELRFSQSIGINETLTEDDNIKIFNRQNTISISRNKPQGNLSVAIYSLAGQMVFKNEFGKEELLEFTVDLPKAYYIVKVKDNKAERAQTIVIP